jgi:large subunit ribosomal protein L9
MYKEFELEKRRVDKQEAVLVTESKALAEKLSGITSVSIEVNTNDEGLLYGAVSPSMVADALKDQGLKVEARAIEIAEPIKKVGTYEVVVNLHREVKPKLKVWVLSTKPVKGDAGAKAEDKKEAPKS